VLSRLEVVLPESFDDLTLFFILPSYTPPPRLPIAIFQPESDSNQLGTYQKTSQD
jgi:hypothetical protein